MRGQTPPPRGNDHERPASHRCAQQPRPATREARHRLVRDARAGAAGSASGTLLLWTVGAVVVAAVLIAAAVILTRRSANDITAFHPIAPSVVTPSNIPAHGRTLGEAGARVTIDIYEDFRCTGCSVFRTEIEPTLESEYVATGKARIAFHDFLTIDRGGNTESRDAANAALCAADQGRFWPMHDWLFANQSPRELPGYFTADRLVAIGKAAGMDMGTFEACVRSGTHDREIQAEQGAAGFSIHYTPSIFVNGSLVENPNNPQAIPTAAQIGAAVDRSLGPPREREP